MLTIQTSELSVDSIAYHLNLKAVKMYGLWQFGRI